MSQPLWLLPLYLYSYRWPIEVFFYEIKTFWSFGLYRLRGKVGIENFVNRLTMSYACMKILPAADQHFSLLADESAQTVKYVLSDAIRRELFLCTFVSNSETAVNSHLLFDALPCPCDSLSPSIAS